MNTATQSYNKAKLWQIICFPLNNTATNMFMFLMMFVSYLAVGGYGIAVVLVSSIITATRLFDAITDPIIGFIIDKTNSRIGKFRPMILIGYITMTLSILAMFFVGIGSGVVTFVVIYLIYIIGYTFQTACTKSAQTCITNDPKQRPLFTRFDGIFMLLQFSLEPMYVSMYLQPKYHQFNVAAMQEFAVFTIIITGILTALAVAALWEKDIPKNWGVGEHSTKVKFRDYLSVIKGNRPMQMLVVAASTDKLASTAAGNSSINILIFGMIIGNYAFYGKLGLYTIIPSIIIIMFGTKIAQKKGSKETLIQFTWLAMISAIVYLAVFLVFDPKDVGTAVLPTAVFLIVYCIFTGVKNISGNIVIPMIADCADYETYLSGRYVPGMMGTLFSFIDKLISSLATTVVGLFLVSIGYTTTLPQVGDPTNRKIFWVSMIVYLGLPILGWIASLIAMRFYTLDSKKMAEVQAKLEEIKSGKTE